MKLLKIDCYLDENMKIFKYLWNKFVGDDRNAPWFCYFP